MNNVRLISENDIKNVPLQMSPDGAVNLKAVGIASTTVGLLGKQGAFVPATEDSYDLNNPLPIDIADTGTLERLDVNPPASAVETVTPSTAVTAASSTDVTESKELPSTPEKILAQEPIGFDASLLAGNMAAVGSTAEEGVSPELNKEQSSMFLQSDGASLDTKEDIMTDDLVESTTNSLAGFDSMPKTLNGFEDVQPNDLPSVSIPSLSEAPIVSEESADTYKNVEDSKKELNALKERIIADIDSVIAKIDSIDNKRGEEQQLSEPSGNIEQSQGTSTIIPSAGPTEETKSLSDLGIPTLDTQFSTHDSTSDGLIDPMAMSGRDIPFIDDMQIQGSSGKFV